MGKHVAHCFYSLEELLEHMECSDPNDNTVTSCRRYWIRKWKKATREGNRKGLVIIKCVVCSGGEQKAAIKLGKYKESRPTKAERDELDPKRNV